MRGCGVGPVHKEESGCIQTDHRSMMEMLHLHLQRQIQAGHNHVHGDNILHIVMSCAHPYTYSTIMLNSPEEVVLLLSTMCLTPLR